MEQGGADHEKEYLATPDAELRSLSLISGHFPYRTFAKKDIGPRYTFTVLREPVERILSTYYYISGWKGHPYHAMLAKKSLSEFVNGLIKGRRYNGQCRFLNQKATFAAAMESFRSDIDLIGVSEHMQPFLDHLGRELFSGKATALSLERRNENKGKRMRRDEVDDDLVKKILTANLEDYKLWTHVVERGCKLVNTERLKH